ncbi:MAG: hypothetical protein JOS17DRAFT_828105 [Linnemannia elongata]|nr:MAG: hypothetical protein JOS17DRAFT_828105 [Linnemannia elongata]
MKIPKILAVLAAAAFTTHLNAAPRPLPSHPPTTQPIAPPSAPPSVPPSNSLPVNGTLPGDLTDLFERVVTVGIAPNPTRVQIFRNAMTCDRNGFSTLYTFTAHTKQDGYLAPKPMWSALGSNPSRSMMVLYPLYNGDTHGWRWAYYLQYKTHFRPASDAEMITLRSDFSDHLEVHKKLKIDHTSDVATKRFKRFSVGNFGSYEVMIGDKVHAAASMKAGPEMRAESLRVASLESMRAGQLMMVSVNPNSPKENVVVFVQGSVIVIGDDAKVFGASHL